MKNVLKKQNKKYIVLLLFVVLVLTTFTHIDIVSAQVVVLEDLPGTGIPTNAGIGPYLSGVVSFTIGIAIALAVLMVTIGGVKYMMTGSVLGKTDAKETIGAALGGLVLALASVLILQTINQDLISFNLAETIKTLSDQAKSGADTN